MSCIAGDAAVVAAVPGGHHCSQGVKGASRGGPQVRDPLPQGPGQFGGIVENLPKDGGRISCY